MVDGDGACLGESDAVAHHFTVLHDLHDFGNIVILLYRRQDCLNGINIGIQSSTLALNFIDSLLQFAESVQNIIISFAGAGQ